MRRVFWGEGGRRGETCATAGNSHHCKLARGVTCTRIVATPDRGRVIIRTSVAFDRTANEGRGGQAQGIGDGDRLWVRRDKMSTTLLCYTILYYTILCYAMLCYAMLCYAILYYAIL